MFYRVVTSFLVLLTLSGDAEIADRLRAVVNGEIITQSDIDQQVALRAVSRAIPADLSQTDLERTVLDQLVSQKILLQEMKANPPSVTAQEIDRDIAELRSLYASPEEFTKALQEHNLTMDQLRAMTETKLKILKFIKERFHPQVTVTEKEIADYYENTFVPQAKRAGTRNIPKLEQVAPEIREILTETAINQKMELFLRQRRRASNIKIL